MLDIAAATSGTDTVTQLTARIVAAYVTNNPIQVAQLPAIIQSVHHALRSLAGAAQPNIRRDQKPSVAIDQSITDDYLVCLEDGKNVKLLKRHLRSAHALTPTQYCSKWALPSNYPMVAPSYAAKRSNLAKEYGLGRSRNGASRKHG